MMQLSKRPFQKRGIYQLGRFPNMGFSQPYIAPWAWPLPRHSVWGQASLDPIHTGRCCTKDPGPAPHQDLPTEGHCDDTEALWQLRGGQMSTRQNVSWQLTLYQTIV